MSRPGEGEVYLAISLSRKALRYLGSQLPELAVGDEWIAQCACAVKKGGTAVIPSF